jgi:GTP 3',8-cyclase
MANRTIPIFPQNTASTLTHTSPSSIDGTLLDTLQRPLRDLRISVTDRCNFRCVYCMPRAVFDQDYPYLPRSEMLTFEEITRVAKLLVTHGVTKIRLTGGEPLLRKNVEQLVGMLRQIDTSLDLTLTTNGALLAQHAQRLKEAGLNRVTVSLDALDDVIFKRMNDADFSVSQVLHGLDVAHQVGLGPIKVNMVVKAGVNDDQIIPMARHFKGSPFILRFIEYMDVGSTNGWTMNDVISSQSIMERIDALFHLVPVTSSHDGETARRWRYQDGSGEIGVISSVTQAFCRDCTRLRLSTEGKLYTCLFADQGTDIRTLLRNDADDVTLSSALAHVWKTRRDRYSELRGQHNHRSKKVEMSYIGG